MKFLIVAGSVMMVAFGLTGCGAADAESATEQLSVFLCRETGELVRAPRQAVPAINPSTGRATLQLALYCEECNNWHAVPPPYVYPGNPLGYPCPKHRTAMSETGPTDVK